MVVPFFFFFERKVVQLADKPFEGLTVERLAQRTVCALTDEPRRNQPWLQEESRKLAYWQDRTLSRRKLLSSEHEHGCRSKYIAWLRSAQPFLFPGSSKLSSRCYLFIYLKWAQRRVKKRWWTRVWFLCRFYKPDVLVWFGSTFVTWRTLSRSVAIHSPPICARCHRASKMTPGTCTFFFRFFFWRQTLFTPF